MMEIDESERHLIIKALKDYQKNFSAFSSASMAYHIIEHLIERLEKE